MWSQSYERKFNDIFKVQEEIADTVARALQVALGDRPATPASQEPDVAAYNLLLKGNYFLVRRGTGDFDRAIEQYQQALGLDPRYALAWANLAYAYSRQAELGQRPVADARLKSQTAAMRALALDPNSAKAHFALGEMYAVLDWDWTAAEREYAQAIALDRSGEVGRSSTKELSYLRAVQSGRFEQINHVLLQAVARDPLSTSALNELAYFYFVTGNFPRAVELFRRLLDLNPAYVYAQGDYGIALAMTGKAAEGLAAAAKEPDEGWRLWARACIYWTMGRHGDSDDARRQLESQFSDYTYPIAEIYAHRGELDAAFHWLDRAYAHRDAQMYYLKVEWLLRNLHSDPRFKVLLRKMKLPET
jgi:tetratricopeptide (TPR) repeat protein